MITELEVENFKASGMKQRARFNSVAAAPEAVDGAFTNRLRTSRRSSRTPSRPWRFAFFDVPANSAAQESSNKSSMAQRAGGLGGF
jgi:hypothetical protein